MSIREIVFILHEHDVISHFSMPEFERCARQQTAIAPPDALARLSSAENVLAEPSAEPSSGHSLRVKAAYVQVGNHNYAEAMVLFYLPVLAGHVQAGWYMPLQRLASSAGRGPNMGAGRINLACHSQCAIRWHADSLWEPVTSDFMAIRKALRETRAFHFASSGAASSDAEVANYPGLNSAVAQIQRNQLKHNPLKQGGLKANAHNDPEVEDLKRTLRTEVETYRQQLAQLQQEIERQKSLNEQLQRQHQHQQQNAHQLQNQQQSQQENPDPIAPDQQWQDHQQQLAQLRAMHCQQVEEYQQQIEQLQHQLEQGGSIHSSPVGVELTDNDQQQLLLRLEQLEDASAERFISRLEALDAVLVAFHPGAGHLTINAANMALYADNPVAYAAGKCFVCEADYRAWLEHYDSARCQQCQQEVPRIEQPRNFKPDVHSFCESHR